MGHENLHSVEAERALLGAILYDPANLDQVAGELDDEHFYDELHRGLFGTMRRLASDGRALNPIVIAPYFRTDEDEDGSSVLRYITGLLTSVPMALPAAAKSYAQTVREFAERRSLANAGLRLQQLAGDPNASAAQVAGEAVQELDALIAASRENGAPRLNFEATAHKLIEDARNGETVKTITTGLRDLDRVTGGLRRGEYTIIAARPSMGKSAMAAALMMNAARAGHGVMMFSLEMTKASVAARCLSDSIWNRDTPIPYADILKGNVSDFNLERLERAAHEFGTLPAEIDEHPALTIAEIAARARRHAARLSKDGKQLDLVIIDHLGKVRASKRYAGNLVAETGEISAGLAALGKDLNVAIIALHQLNRAVEGREDKHPQLSDLRNSGDIEQDADLIGFLYRPAYYLERMKLEDPIEDDARQQTAQRRRHELEVLISKNRNGPCVTCDLFIDVASNAIRNRAA